MTDAYRLTTTKTFMFFLTALDIPKYCVVFFESHFQTVNIFCGVVVVLKKILSVLFCL